MFKWQYFGSTGLNKIHKNYSYLFLLNAGSTKNLIPYEAHICSLQLNFYQMTLLNKMNFYVYFCVILYWLFSKASRVSVLDGKTKDSWDQGFVWGFSFLCAFLLVVFFTYAFVFLCFSGCSENQKSKFEKVQKFWRCETLVHVLSLLFPIYWNLGHLLNFSKPLLYLLRREGQGV